MLFNFLERDQELMEKAVVSNRIMGCLRANLFSKFITVKLVDEMMRRLCLFVRKQLSKQYDMTVQLTLVGLNVLSLNAFSFIKYLNEISFQFALSMTFKAHFSLVFKISINGIQRKIHII